MPPRNPSNENVPQTAEQHQEADLMDSIARFTLQPQTRAKKNQESKPRKLVSFNRRVRCVPIKHVEDFSEEDMERIWHSSQEKLAMQIDMKNTVRSMKKYPHEDYFKGRCYRGLEHFTSAQVLRQRCADSKGHKDAVLCAQDEGNASYVEQVSTKSSRLAAARAIVAAKQDAIEALSS